MKPPRGGEKAPSNVSTTISVRVLPRSSRDEVAGVSEGVLRIRLTAPPLENRANDALVQFLSKTVGIPRRQVEILAGGRGRNKIVRIHGIGEGELFRRIDRISPEGIERPGNDPGAIKGMTGKKGVPEG